MHKGIKAIYCQGCRKVPSGLDRNLQSRKREGRSEGGTHWGEGMAIVNDQKGFACDVDICQFSLSGILIEED